MADELSTILETTQAERLATGFVFTEGRLWQPDGFYDFVDVRSSVLYRLTPGRPHEVVREKTGGGNGTTFDLQGRLVICEGENRRVARMAADGRVEALVDRFEGKRLNRPNDVVCKSDGSIYFTDPGLRVPLAERELPYAGVYRVMPDGVTSLVADFEYPNGLAFSPDERRLYVANTRWAQYIHVLDLDPSGKMVRRRILADMAQAAESLGFRNIWLAEHHFSTYGYVSRPAQLATFIAAKTTRLRVGTAVIVVPLHHPLVVAEELATLDILAGGRVDVGLGRGYQHYEFERLGLELDTARARWEGSVDIILTAFSARPSTYDG